MAEKEHHSMYVSPGKMLLVCHTRAKFHPYSFLFRRSQFGQKRNYFPFSSADRISLPSCTTDTSQLGATCTSICLLLSFIFLLSFTSPAFVFSTTRPDLLRVSYEAFLILSHSPRRTTRRFRVSCSALTTMHFSYR